MNSYSYLRVIVPSAIIGVGMATSAIVSIPVGIIIMGAGVATVAFGKSCVSIDQQKVPITPKRSALG